MAKGGKLKWLLFSQMQDLSTYLKKPYREVNRIKIKLRSDIMCLQPN